MNDAADLHTAIATHLWDMDVKREELSGEFATTIKKWQDEYLGYADAFIADVLTDPEFRLAILEAMGLDFREAHEVRWSDGVSYGENYVQFHDVPNELREYVSPVLVVRPRDGTS